MKGFSPVSIALLDDHQLFLKGLAMVVKGMSDDFSVTSFNGPVQLVDDVLAGKSFDLIISDLIMDEMSGLGFLELIRRHTADLPILILTGINNPPPIAEIVSLGANGYLHKSAGEEILREAIETLLSGNSYFRDDFQQHFSSEFRAAVSQPDSALPKLAPRQIEVLKLISSGASNREISDKLSISENTVKAHLRQIFIELGVNKRTACVRRAQDLGII